MKLVIDCGTCGGSGVAWYDVGRVHETVEEPCLRCGGTGEVAAKCDCGRLAAVERDGRLVCRRCADDDLEVTRPEMPVPMALLVQR